MSVTAESSYTLFYSPGTCAVAPHIILEYVKAPYSLYLAKIGDEQLAKINPSNAVPALLTPDLRPLSQNPAILYYLAETFSQFKLGPAANKQSSYDFNYWMSLLASDAHPVFWPIYNWQRFTTSTDDRAKQHIQDAAKAQIANKINIINDHLQQNSYFVENRFTIIDTFGFAILRWLHTIDSSLAQLSGVDTFLNKMYEMPSVQTVLAQQGLDK